MIELKVYIKGAGLKSSGDRVIAVRDEKPNVITNNYYTIERIVEEGACGSRNTLIKLREIESLYSPGTFRTDNNCRHRE